MDYIQADPANHSETGTMRYSTQVKSISYLKANAAEILQTLTEQREPVLITQNGEAKAVLQDVATYEETQDTIALLKMLAIGEREIEQGRIQPLADAVDELRTELRKEFGAAA